MEHPAVKAPSSGAAALARERRARLNRLAWFAVAVVGALAGIATLASHLTNDPLADVHAYYDAAARLNGGQPLYPPGADTNMAEFYRYPPLLAIAFRPLALLPFPIAAGVWELVCLMTFALTLWVLGVRRYETWIAVGVLGLAIGWALPIGQAQVPVTWLLAIASPWAVALAANLKLFPALVAVYWLARRDLRRLGAFMMWMAGLAALQLALEPRGTIAFLQLTNLAEVGEVKNLSPYAVHPVLWVVLVAALGLGAWRLARTRWGWAAAIALSILATPRLLSYMFMTFLAALVQPPTDGRRRRPWLGSKPVEEATR